MFRQLLSGLKKDITSDAVMNLHKSKFVICIFGILCLTFGYSQEMEELWVESVSISVFNERVTTPFKGTDAIRTHWGGTLAYEASRKRNGIYQFTHIFQGGYYNHTNLNQVGFVSWKPKFELHFNDTFNIHAILGVGYAHSFPTQPSYRLEEGTYTKKNNWGTPHFMPSMGIGSGLHLDMLLDVPIELFVRYEAFSLAPYKPKGSLPFTPNTMLGFGLKYSFN